MPEYNKAFLDDTFNRFATLAPDTEPQWGSMRPPQLFAHLQTAVAYSLGKEKETPNEGGFLGRWLAGPLILSGIIKIPKNTKGPKMYDAAAPEATLGDFRAEAEEFLERYQAGTLPDIAHPYFGNFGVEGWKKLHIIHFQHHMAQFGV